MKRLLALLLICLLFAFALPAMAEEGIPGIWEMTRLIADGQTFENPAAHGSSKIILFSEDGTAVVTINKTSYNATWTLAGDTLHLVYEDGDKADFAVTEELLTYETATQTQYFTRRVVYADAADFDYKLSDDGSAIITRYHGSDAVVNIPEALDGYPVRTIGYGAFASSGRMVSAAIPRSVRVVEDWAFAKCSSLTSITIPASVKSIGSNAFYECAKLAKVTLPEGVDQVAPQAFMGCKGLASVVIPASVKTIGLMAFADCESLAAVTLPEGLEALADAAFARCAGLQRIELPASLQKIDGNPFTDCPPTLVVAAPTNSYAAVWCQQQGNGQ